MSASTEEDIGTEPVTAHLTVLVKDKLYRERAMKPARAIASQVLKSVNESPSAEAALFELRRYAELHGAKVEKSIVSVILDLPESDWPVSVSVTVDHSTDV